MTIKDTYRYLIGGYFGVEEMDEYKTKEYILKEIREYIDDYLKNNKADFDVEAEYEDVNKNVPLETKLHDALLVLPKIDAPIDLILLVKDKIKELNDK
jgi:hypothetical protein